MGGITKPVNKPLSMEAVCSGALDLAECTQVGILSQENLGTKPEWFCIKALGLGYSLLAASLRSRVKDSWDGYTKPTILSTIELIVARDG